MNIYMAVPGSNVSEEETQKAIRENEEFLEQFKTPKAKRLDEIKRRAINAINKRESTNS
jgi:hypothetical protein